MTDPKTVLIIEDEVPMRRVLVDAFIAQGFRVIEAGDGEDGLARAKAEHPDAILLDIILPKMDGLTVLRHLRDDAWGKNAVVIILTNLSDAERVGEAMGRHVYDFLVKTDWDPAQVVERVQKKLKLA
jgi:DNA-binding response OmpR family regulator